MNNLSLEERLAQMGRDLKHELCAGKELGGGFFTQMGKLFVEQLLGAEVTDALGRAKSQRRGDGEAPDGGGAAGYRNGYKGRSLLTGEGEIEVQVPQEARAAAFIEQYRGKLPSAVACFENDREASLNHLKLPTLHHKSIRTTNLVERGFEEERRRSKVIPKFRTEKECLKLVFATLWRASERWLKVKFTQIERTQLEAYVRVRQAMGKHVRDVAVAA
jgi:transposase-like protein